MKGSLILTEGRSGSNWLISLTNGTGVLGNGGEWFANWYLTKSLPKTAEELVERVLATSSTKNGYFCVKIFPAHVHWIQIQYGFDLIKYFIDHHDVNLVRLTRKDRFRQAISYARGVQTQQWTKHNVAKREAEYDFEMICRCFFLLERSDSYWSAYFSLRQISSKDFIYEELLEKPDAFVDCLAQHCGCTVSSIPPSKHSIQRDTLTEKWLEQFLEDVSEKSVVASSTPSRQAAQNVSNLLRFLRGEPLKPYPYAY